MRVLTGDELASKAKSDFDNYLTVILSCIAFLLTVGFNTSHAIAIDPLESSDKSKASPSKTVFISIKAPPIKLRGRDGARDFADINEKIERASKEVLVKEVREYLEKNPKSGLAHEILGTLLFTSGKVGEAAKSFELAIEFEPDQNGPKTKLGVILMELGRLREAENLFLGALEIDPSDRFASQRLGLLYEYLGKDDLAIKSFQDGLIGTDDSYLGVAFNLGRLLNKQGRFRETVTTLESRLPLSFSAKEPHLVLGAAYLSTEQFELAMERFSRVQELDDESREAKIGKVMSLKGLGQLEEALRQSKALVQEHPRWSIAHFQMGDILLDLNRLAEAQTVFDSAVKRGANQHSVQRRLAKYHLRNKEYSKAKQIYAKLLTTDAVMISDYTQLSELQRAQKEYDQGLNTLKAAIEKFPDNSYLYMRLGSEYATLRQYDEAAPVLKRGLEINPNDPRGLRDYSLVLGKLGDTKGAVEYARRLKDLLPLQSSESLFYATRLEADGQNDEAEEVYREVLKADRENVIALNNLANLLAKKNKFVEAERYARHANRVIKDNPQLLDTLGWILYQKGKYKQAAELLGKAADRAPDMAIISYHNGMAQFEAGNRSAAKAALQRALALDGDADWAGNAKQKLAE